MIAGRAHPTPPPAFAVIQVRGCRFSIPSIRHLGRTGCEQANIADTASTTVRPPEKRMLVASTLPASQSNSAVASGFPRSSGGN